MQQPTRTIPIPTPRSNLPLNQMRVKNIQPIPTLLRMSQRLLRISVRFIQPASLYIHLRQIHSSIYNIFFALKLTAENQCLAIRNLCLRQQAFIGIGISGCRQPI